MIETQISTTDRPGLYHLGIRESESYAASKDKYEFEARLRLDEIEDFAMDLYKQVKALKGEQEQR